MFFFSKKYKKYNNLEAQKNVEISGDCEFAKGTIAGNNTYLHNVSLGNYSYLSDYGCARDCTIGKYCSIGRNVTIGLGKHPSEKFVSTHPAFFFDVNQKMFTYADNKYVQEFKQIAKVTIGNDVWIGDGALIMGGISIGDGAIVGAGAVVVKDVEPYSIVGGVPARPIRYRFEPEEIDFLKKFKWWNKDEEWIRKNFRNFSDIKKFMAQNADR